ncbi:MAG: hypothetical protein ACRDQB_09755, partial [Thermocrispum sp.]
MLAAIVGAVRSLGTDRARRAVTGMMFGIVIWLVMQFGGWRVIDPWRRRCSPRGCSHSGMIYGGVRQAHRLTRRWPSPVSRTNAKESPMVMPIRPRAVAFDVVQTLMSL